MGWATPHGVQVVCLSLARDPVRQTSDDEMLCIPTC